MVSDQVLNDTIRKFGHPTTLIADYRYWVVLLRPQQATLGALVLACKGPATAFSEIGAEACQELAKVTRDIEATLKDRFAYDKINYLMLMMVDREVHFHVLPRYAEDRAFAGLTFTDPGWPAVPALGSFTEIGDSVLLALRDHLRQAWPRAEPSGEV